MSGARGPVEPRPDEDSLTRLAVRGDRDAFSRLYERYERLVHAILLVRGGPRDVEDLCQEVFLAAWRGIGGLREQSKFGPWLAAIARNQAASHLRLRRDHESIEKQQIASPPNPAAEAFLLLDHLRQLPETYRETLALRFVEGMTGPEIAEATGMTHGSVRVNLSRGVEMIRERLRTAKAERENR